MIQLKGNQTTTDPRLDRVKQFDEHSRNFGVAQVIKPTPIRGRSWPLHLRLDQGKEGACVGFGHVHRIAAQPGHYETPFRNSDAYLLYKQAQELDDWPGQDYSGTSVLAGAKAATARNLYREYRWCFSIDEIVATLVSVGPVVVGTNWLDGMFEPRPDGLLDVSGSVAGGHCYLIRGLVTRPRYIGIPEVEEPVFRITNSWGSNWGKNGDCYIKVSDYETKLMADADQCVPLES